MGGRASAQSLNAGYHENNSYVERGNETWPNLVMLGYYPNMAPDKAFDCWVENVRLKILRRIYNAFSREALAHGFSFQKSKC